MALALLTACATARAELIEDEPIRPKPRLDAERPTKPVERLPLVIDEPDFKATVVFPEQPAPNFDTDGTGKDKKRVRISRTNWGLPQEDGVDFSAAPPDAALLDLPEQTKEEISPLLAKAIARDKAGRKAKDSIAIYQEVVSAEPENAPALYRLGLAFARAGDVRSGAEVLEKALNLQPRNPKYQCDFGLVALQAGWLEKAVTATQWAAAAVPANARFQSALGDCLLATGRVSAAADAYDRAWKLEPDNAEYIHNLALAHLHGKAFKKAIEICNEAIRLRPNHAPYYCTRGLANENNRNQKDAIPDYQIAVKLDKNFAYGHYLLASVYSDPDDPTFTSAYEAVEHASKAVTLTNGRNAQYLMGLARALRVARQYDKALDAARRAVSLEPRDDYKKELMIYEKLRGESIR
ncbi:MAG TPA: tetratricopeptide repeat protein [Planctomycetota bacterium]|nr:tetratricopeptide repeat protein [Planctomycetota bacterium]